MSLKLLNIGMVYAAQVEACGLVNVYLGNHLYVLTTESRLEEFRKNRQRKHRKIWPFHLHFFRHTGQSDIVEIFSIGYNSLAFRYRTRGEVTPRHHRANEIGLKLIRKGKKKGEG